MAVRWRRRQCILISNRCSTRGLRFFPRFSAFHQPQLQQRRRMQNNHRSPSNNAIKIIGLRCDPIKAYINLVSKSQTSVQSSVRSLICDILKNNKKKKSLDSICSFLVFIDKIYVPSPHAWQLSARKTHNYDGNICIELRKTDKCWLAVDCRQRTCDDIFPCALHALATAAKQTNRSEKRNLKRKKSRRRRYLFNHN